VRARTGQAVLGLFGFLESGAVVDEVQRVHVVVPLEVYASGFRAELTRLGYAFFRAFAASAGRALSRWLAGKGLDTRGG
jgi:hypothetical protein